MKPSNPKTISIIIPVLNEEAYIGKLLTYLQNSSSKDNPEIIVVDGGSKDNTIGIAKTLGATVLRSRKGRAIQMNLGARHACGDILYFLHVDTLPPKNFDNFIVQAVAKGHEAGCFRMRFDSTSWFLKFFASLTRINHRICRGGDQSLYVTKEIFWHIKGFNENYIIYEDSEFIGRLYKTIGFKVLREWVITSARKYEKNGVVKLQYHFGVIHLKSLLGAGPDKLYDYYKRNIVV